MPETKKVKLSHLNAYDVSPFEGSPAFGKMIHADVGEEYFEYIKHLCIKSKYNKVFGLTTSGEEYGPFQTFIEQSYQYFLLAKNASFQVAPLCYYYSFLNLMKAYLVPNHWRHNRAKFASHGLKPKRSSAKGGEILNDYLVITEGIFNLAIDDLMKNSTKGQYKGKELVVKDLLLYLPGINIEIQNLLLSNPKYFPVSLKIETNDNQCDLMLSTNRSWWIAEQYPLPEWSPKRLNVNLQKYFKTPNKKKDTKWDFQLREKLYIVDDTIKNNNDAIQKLMYLISSIAPFWDVFEQTKNNGFLIPYSRNFVLPAELVILSVMYYLSLLVRYRPYELERLKAEDAELLWLYKCIVRNSVLTYYQLLCSRLQKKYVRFYL